MRIAVVGKGGAGKSFVTGTLARLIARRGDPVVVLDSDPMPGVAVTLGLGPISDDMLADAVERGPDDRWQLKKGVGPATAVKRFSREGPDGVRLLQFGKSDDDGLGPIMGSLNGFTRVVHRLASEDVLAGWTIIGDLPAGPRQTAYDWAPYARRYVLVAEPTWQSVLTARRIARLAAARTPSSPLLVVNKVRDPSDVAFVTDQLQLPELAAIPHDPAVVAADRAGVALIDDDPDSRAVEAVRGLLDALDETGSDGSAGSVRDVITGGRP